MKSKLLFMIGNTHTHAYIHVREKEREAYTEREIY